VSSDQVSYAWKDVDIASISAGDVLRVKQTAYSSAAGAAHNGRIVKVIEVKDGDIHVTSIDLRTPHITNARHPAYRLEKKVVLDFQ
jgi:Ni,Fe-hydrogenase III large subunit